VQTTQSLLRIDDYLCREEGRSIPFKPWKVIGKQGLIDWVCERDFFLGVPRSGKTAGYLTPKAKTPTPCVNPVVGHPYVAPWGPIREGANVEVGQFELSAWLTSLSIELWKAVQEANPQKELLVRDLPRFPGPPLTSTEELQKLPLIEYLENVEKWVFGPDAKKQRAEEPVLDK